MAAVVAVAADYWPLSWVSPRHAHAFLMLLLLPLLHAATAMTIAEVVCGRRSCTVVTSHHWALLTLIAVLPVAALLFTFQCVGFWYANNSLSVYGLRVWFHWLGVALGLVVMGVAAVVARVGRDRLLRDSMAWVGGVGGVLAVTGWAFATAFGLADHAGSGMRLLSVGVDLSGFLPILITHLAATVSFATAFVSSEHERTRLQIRVGVVVSAAIGCALVVTAPWWLPVEVFPAYKLDTHELSGGFVPARWSIVCVFAWFSLGVVAAFFSGVRARTAALVLAVVAANSLQVVWAGHREPWVLRGLLYENGVDVETVRAFRRSPVGLAEDGRPVGARLFERQCAVCHARRGPFADWRKRLFSDGDETRERLEELRDADRLGHRFRGVMPPLIGSDEEIDAFAAWIHGGSSWAINP